ERERPLHHEHAVEVAAHPPNLRSGDLLHRVLRERADQHTHRWPPLLLPRQRLAPAAHGGDEARHPRLPHLALALEDAHDVLGDEIAPQPFDLGLGVLAERALEWFTFRLLAHHRLQIFSITRTTSSSRPRDHALCISTTVDSSAPTPRSCSKQANFQSARLRSSPPGSPCSSSRRSQPPT